MKSTLLVFLLVAFPAAKLLAADAPRPNILYLYVDDMGWGSIGPNGQAARKANGLPYVRTPNINQLAAEGVNFRRGYACTVCSPSRASQQSGFHQGHTFSDRNDPNNAKKAMRADDILMGDVLSAAGYETGYWGKWGYGGSKDQLNPEIDNVQTLPTSHGYRHVLAELHHVRAHTFFQPTLWKAPAREGAVGGLELVPNSMVSYRDKSSYPNTPALQNHADYPKTGYCDDSYAFAALDFVRAQGVGYNKTGKPFFGLLAVQIPHAPFDEVATLPEWNHAYADDPHFAKLAKQSQQWAAMVTRIDAHFGNILAALEDPNNDGNKDDSIADNTLVIFQSDNGGPGGKNNVELDANGGLSGNKGSIKEGGIRVPLVMRWPDRIKADSTLTVGSNTEMVVDITDLLPTFCDLAGARIPLGLDGVSIAPTLLSREDQRRRDFIIHEARADSSIIQGDYKLVRSAKSPIKLFNLKTDPAESNNVAADHPELVKKLETLLLGERVTEPKGFANTYHHWTGRYEAKTSDPDNWSDYEYANAGISYMKDAGAPQLSWTARIVNKGKLGHIVRGDADLNCLGIEVAGNRYFSQRLTLDPGVNLTGRNEVRIGRNGALTVDGGRISSLRWLEIEERGWVDGRGTIDCTVYNSGTIRIGESPSPQPAFNISGDYHQTETGTLTIVVDGDKNGQLVIDGTATLAGSLNCLDIYDPEFRNPSMTVLTAKKITGRFTDPRLGAFKVRYTDTSVIIEPVAK